MDHDAPKQLAHKIIGRHGVHVLLRAHCGPEGLGLSAGKVAIKLRGGATKTTCTTRIAHGGQTKVLAQSGDKYASEAIHAEARMASTSAINTAGAECGE